MRQYWEGVPTEDKLSDIRAARALIADPANWCRGDTARERRIAGPMCAAQAVRAAVPIGLTSQDRMERVEVALGLLNVTAGRLFDRSLVGVNDQGPEGSGREVGSASDEACYDAVMVLFDRAELHLMRSV